jgi:ATP-dependent protease Clp ATPase subunit
MLGAVNECCSFCGRPRQEAFKLIAGPFVRICDACVAICVRAIESEKAAASSDVGPYAKDMEKAPTESKLRCRFCGKSQRDVKYLIAGPTVHICDTCVVLCVEIIEEDKAAQKPPV